MQTVTALFLTLFVAMVYSHAALTYPPARNAVGTSTDPNCSGDYCKINYDFFSANKGDQTGAWSDSATHICGAADFIKPAASVVGTFTAGSVLNIRISVNAFHDGYYEFRLCIPTLVSDYPPSTNQGMIDCLMSSSTPLLKRVTPLAEGQRAVYKMDTSSIPTWDETQRATRWRQNPEDGTSVTEFRGTKTFELSYYLPNNVQCEHCVLHWYWQSLNSWQTGDAKTIATTQGERFWNCADIAITNSKANGVKTGIIPGLSADSSSSSSSSGQPTPTPTPVTPTPTPVTPTPTPVTPTPTPTTPTPTPSPTATATSSARVSCASVKYGSDVGTWWIAVHGPAGYDVSIGCGSGPSAKRSCYYDKAWGRYSCSLSYGSYDCPATHVAYFTGSTGNTDACTLDKNVISYATETTAVEEGATPSDVSSQEVADDDDEEDAVDYDSVPGWAVALLVVGSITIVVLFVLLALMLKSSPSGERF